MCCAKIITSVVNINGLLRLYNLDAFHIFLRRSKILFSGQVTWEFGTGGFHFHPHLENMCSFIQTSLSLLILSFSRRSDTFWLISLSSYPHLCSWVVKAANLWRMRKRSLTNLFAQNDNRPHSNLSQWVWVQLVYLVKTC